MKAVVQKEEDRSKAAMVSFLFHAAFFALLWFYKIYSPEAPVITPEILINFNGGGGDNAAAGEPDKGMNDAYTPPGQQMEDKTSHTPVDEPKPEPRPAKPEPAKPTHTPPAKADLPKNTPTTDDPEVAAVRRAQKDKQERDRRIEDENRRQQREEAEQIAQAKREQQRRAQEEADRKQREQDAYNEQKGKYGSKFGKPGSNGGGAGGGGKPGNGGIPGGTGDNPFGKSNGSGGGDGGGIGSGSGEGIGGGLRGRKVTSRPSPDCPVSDKGKVVVRVTVDAGGSVVSATATQAGSTLTDSQSRSCAEQTARRFRFAPSNEAAQSGTIEVRFNFN